MSAPMSAKTDEESDEAALNRLLDAEPHSVSAHVRLGDIRARQGEAELARYYYRRALSFADCQDLPDEVAVDLRRAEAALSEFESSVYAKREALMIERGFPADRWSPRFRHSLELAAGRRKLYRPDPTNFHYPGLPAIQFFDREQFGWAAAVEAAVPAIRDELLAELGAGADQFRPYVQGQAVNNQHLLDKKDWSILPLCERGWVSTYVTQRFPRTWEAIRQAPLPAIFGWGPTVVFSKLKAGAHIEPHTGMFNTRLICHLPLIVPPGCRFRVGDDVREWEPGKLLIFDDTIEHEAWNDGPEDRVILIFDIWRPELSEQERTELTALFHT
jgi:aspartyl/asparaginyl beta-hydroxylase (cupin superfamily)